MRDAYVSIRAAKIQKEAKSNRKEGLYFFGICALWLAMLIAF